MSANMISELNTTLLTITQRIAYTTILNLRKLTVETGTRTTKAQNDILRALNSVDVSAVANALAAQPAVGITQFVKQ
jgi:hypothetical protein